MSVRKAPLRAVSDGEAAPKRVLSVAEAANSDKRALLVAMRDRISRSVDDPGCPPAALAALTKRLQDIARDIEVLDCADQAPAASVAVEVDESFDASAI